MAASGYRSFPESLDHPSQSEQFSEEAFLKLKAEKMEEAPSACAGHSGTVIWYVANRCYVVQVKISGKYSVFLSSLCTFTPTAGMDQVDGLFAQDVEEYVLQKELGFPTKRLGVYKDRPSMPMDEYLRNRGVVE